MDIQLGRDFQIDIDKLGSETQCAADYFAINISWQSSTTGMVDAAPPVAIPPNGTGRIEAKLVGRRLGGTLNLRSAVVLAQRPEDGPTPGSPSLPGSIVAEDHQQLVLERAARMFPLQMLDFARTPYAPDASWHLEVDGDLDTPFMGAFMLLINSRDTELREAVTTSAKNDSQQLLNDELEAGLAALMIELAVESRDDLIANDWPVGSVGHALKNILVMSGLVDMSAPSAQSLTDYRTRIAAAVRRMGHGRLFR